MAAWQRVLMRDGHDLSPWMDDGAFGSRTHNASVAWQAARGLPATGIVDDVTKAAIGTAPGERDGRMLALSALLTAQICARCEIPIRFVDADGLRRDERGITSHWEVTKGPGRGLTTHVDPGRHFPMARYLEMVRDAVA